MCSTIHVYDWQDDKNVISLELKGISTEIGTLEAVAVKKAKLRTHYTRREMPAYNEAILAGNLIPEHSVEFTNFRPHDYSGGLVRLWLGIATLSTPINGGRKSETTMKTKVIRLALSLALVAGLGLSVAVAATESHGAIKAQAKITREEATKTALTKVPNGRIKTAELEKEHGRLIWSFDISMPKSTKITEIQVDANTGKIVSTQVETLADQAKEAAADKKAKK